MMYVAFGRLTHGCKVSIFRAEHPTEWPLTVAPISTRSCQGEHTFLSDAVVSDVPNLFFFMTFADCVPIMLWDPVRRVVGLIHAGWRGTAQHIAAATVRAMCESFASRPYDIRVAIGPSIGPCCYRVGDDVRMAFQVGYGDDTASFFRGQRLDLWAANCFDLMAAGVDESQIENPRLCTACHTESFFSHRAEGEPTGRLGACIGLLS
jgi:YfiH family protein